MPTYYAAVHRELHIPNADFWTLTFWIEKWHTAATPTVGNFQTNLGFSMFSFVFELEALWDTQPDGQTERQMEKWARP